MDRAPETLVQPTTGVSRKAVARVVLRLLVTGRWHLLRHARWIAEYEAGDR